MHHAMSKNSEEKIVLGAIEKHKLNSFEKLNIID
jgi:hypothetical protein